MSKLDKITLKDCWDKTAHDIGTIEPVIIAANLQLQSSVQNTLG